MTSIGIARFASQVIQIRKMDLSAVERYAYRIAMFKRLICSKFIILSVLVAFPACAPDLKVGSQTSSGSMGGAGGMDGSSSSSGGGSVSSSSGGGSVSSSSSSSVSSSSSGSSSGGPPGMLGAACALASECLSGFCADGVCCKEQCDGACVGCNQTGSPGACLSVPVGTDDCSVVGELCNEGGMCACGVAKPPVSTDCPTGWAPGPSPGTCVFSCSAPGDCAMKKIECPPGVDCIVECSGPNSCSGVDAEVECAPDHTCIVSCTGGASCQNGFRMRCSDNGPCGLKCGADMFACLGGELRCGSNACQAICSGVTKPDIDSGNSCSAQGC